MCVCAHPGTLLGLGYMLQGKAGGAKVFLFTIIMNLAADPQSFLEPSMKTTGLVYGLSSSGCCITQGKCALCFLFVSSYCSKLTVLSFLSPSLPSQRLSPPHWELLHLKTKRYVMFPLWLSQKVSALPDTLRSI